MSSSKRSPGRHAPPPGARGASGLAPGGSAGSAASSRRAEDLVRIVGDHYQLGSEIGRGGFGVVYAALDLRNGRSVAIKQVSLRDIDKDELLSIESEISLLKKLNHENIVKYHDTIKTQACLYIVLEYMENGSLAQFVKRFGSLSETLVAMYITQVLRGLAYLHEQGVLHRDVKGANILTTKEGLVKLADFGVAIKLSETQKADDVVGSPYWMAPEVIEMAGWSTSSDIWSVGCTIIELLSTKPPYFDLAPMAALFRIVQDDHPPLPERISPALHDFIMKCFMKEPRLRSSAMELLQHPWIAQIPKNKVEQSTQLIAENVTSTNDRNAVLNTIKLYEKNSSTADGGAPTSNNKPTSQPVPVEEEDEEAENWDDEFGVDAAPTPLSLTTPTESSRWTTSASSTPSSSLLPPTPLNVFKLSTEDASALLADDAWDDEDAAKTSGPTSSSRSSGPRSADTPGNESRDERASRSWDRSALVPKTKRITKLQEFVENDDEEIDFADLDEDELVEAAARKQSEMRRDHSLNKLTLSKFQDEQEEAGNFESGIVLPADRGLVLHTNSATPSSANGFRDSSSSLGSSQQENIFGDELDFDYSTMRDANLKVTARVVDLLSLLDPSMDDQVILEACSNLEEIFRTHATLRRDLMSQPGVVPNIMEALEMKKADVLHAVLKVINMIVEDNQKFQENLALVGLIPVIIKLTKQHNPFLSSGTSGWHHGSAYGAFNDTDSSLAVRLEAAKFVRQSCKTSTLTLQMFVACGGLPVLVDFFTLDRDSVGTSSSEIDLVRIALDGTLSVFNLQTIPKNDICRLFVKAGLLRRFVAVFNEVVSAVGTLEMDQKAVSAHDLSSSSQSNPPQKNNWTVEELNSFCDILLLFSQGDGVVKEHMCDGAVLEGMLKALRPGANALFLGDNRSPREETYSRLLSHSSEYVAAMVKVLKCFRNLSMDPLTLEKLDRAGTIPTLVRLLNEQEAESPPAAGSVAGSATSSCDAKQREVENIVLQTMFYLCRINRNRQTHAAQAGIVPSLIKVIRDSSPLKQFALPILCDLAHASPTARAHLWSCGVASIFLDLLNDPYWQMDAVKSISVWLAHDTAKMENVLLLPANMMKLVSCFQNAQDSELENLLEPTLEIMSRSVPINQSFGRNGLFVTELLRRLRLVPKAIVRKNLLKILKSLFESHTSPIQFLVEYNLHPVVHALAQDENSMILVKEIASQLLQSILVAASVF